MSKIWCPYTCYLLQLTLLLKLHVLVSQSVNHFGNCSSMTCGDVNISYPFHIVSQQEKYCGYPGFEVSCENGDRPYMNISGDSYVIKDISYVYQTFQVMNSVFVTSVKSQNECFRLPQNLTFDYEVFNYAADYKEISLLLNCSPEVLRAYKEEPVVCGTIGVYGNESKVKELEGKCNGIIQVPYEGQIANKRSLREVLEEGFSLKWTANNCSACAVTGGQCGFDQSISEFTCFCHDRTHSHQCHGKNKNGKLRLILGLGIGGVTLLLVALVVIWYRKKLKLGHSKFDSRSISLERSTSDLEKGNIYFGVPLFSYRELQEATDNFDESNELGDGGFGTVYYGKLKDGREVAVKRLYEKSYKRVEQFMNEVQILTRLRHQNLVSLFGCTSHHSRELLLVYEFVSNGTVADHLYGDRAKPGSLPWPNRLRIAIETANALCYLHASDIIHRDVKTNNILLDSSFSVKVADFGLSRLFPIDVTHVSTAPQGTPGYLDPEYHQCYQLTDKSDVYSFGVVLVELISSLPAVDMNRHRHEINLSNYAMTRIQRCAFEELVDSELGYASDFKVRRMTTAVGELAFQCLQHDKEFRPAMDEVLEILKRIENTDYEALQAEEMGRDNADMKSTNPPPPSPTEDDHAKLLSNPKPYPPSPSSVMDNWGSKSTTPNTSN